MEEKDHVSSKQGNTTVGGRSDGAGEGSKQHPAWGGFAKLQRRWGKGAQLGNVQKKGNGGNIQDTVTTRKKVFAAREGTE